MHPELEALESRIVEATGKDRNLDNLIAAMLGDIKRDEPVPEYTSSVDHCIALIGVVLPEWHWHVGHGPLGVIPYAALRKGMNLGDADQLRVDASAPTVPLALLHAAVKALVAEHPQ